jgi:hypothetical protein
MSGGYKIAIESGVSTISKIPVMLDRALGVNGLKGRMTSGDACGETWITAGSILLRPGRHQAGKKGE